MNQHTILLLAANPEELRRLNLDDEARAIRIALQQKGYSDAFKLEVWPAARPLDLLEGLGMLAPTVVHFSGHGGSRGRHQPAAAARRDANGPVSADDHTTESLDAERHGLFFQGPDALPRFVSAAALKETFAAAGSSVKLVVLNACYSEFLANALLPHVGCVVGVAGAIEDSSARQFSVGFYGALAKRQSIETAFAQGRAAIRLDDLSDHDQPKLRVRADVDAKNMIVAAIPSPAAIASSSAPPSEVLNFDAERSRHARFVGRTGLLARLDQLLIEDEADRWVVVTGGPGMGKSALLAQWLAKREAAGDPVPHHFIRRGEYDWDDPAKLTGSLVAQMIARFPEHSEPHASARMHPAARMQSMLQRLSQRELVPHGQRLVVLIDGLDEYDPPAASRAGAPGRDPLAEFLPSTLPPGVSVLCSSRPRHPYVDRLSERGALQLDLDSGDFAEDNAATVRAFWERAALELVLDAAFVAEAVDRAGGNLQHAEMLRKHLVGLPSERWCVQDVPHSLQAFIASTWERISIDPAVVDGLGVMCAAREALTLDELGRVACWSGVASRQAFVRGAREWLIEARRADGTLEYRLHHDSIRAHVAEVIGAEALVAHHRALAERLATWPAPTDPAGRRYALRHALLHRCEARMWADAWRIAANVAFLEAKYRELGVHDTEADVARTAERCRAAGDEVHGQRFADLVRAIGRESHWLREAPASTAALVWNRLHRYGWIAGEIDAQLGVPAAVDLLRVRHVATRENPALVRNLAGHTSLVSACAVTSDGRHVVSASYDGTLKVWELQSGRVRATFHGHSSSVTACAVTPDGRHVVSASRDKTLKVWQLESGQVRATFHGHTSSVTACTVTPDGRYVASASYDHTLKVWELASGRSVATLEGHTHWVTACAVTPDGRQVVSASFDDTLKVWDLATGNAVATLEGHADRVMACAVTPDGRHVISGSYDGTLKVWELASGRAIATLEGHTHWVVACVVTPDGRHVISGSYDGTLKVWELASKRAEATLEGHTHWTMACVVMPDGRHVVSASADKTLKVWELARRRTLAPHQGRVQWSLASGRLLATLAGHISSVNACAVMPNGVHVVSAADDHILKVWELSSGQAVGTLRGHISSVRACAAMPNGVHVVSAADDHTLKVWELSSGQAVATLRGHYSNVMACAVTPDGRYVVSASQDKTLRVWELAREQAVATLHGHASNVNACAVTPDGRHAVSASDDQTLKVWELSSGRAVAAFKGHDAGVTACAVTPDGRHVVSASHDKTLKIWDLAGSRSVATLEGHTSWVMACAITPDGRHVVSASEDKTLKVWDLATGACRITHPGDARYRAVAVSATAVVAGDEAGNVWFLDLPPSMMSPHT